MRKNTEVDNRVHVFKNEDNELFYEEDLQNFDLDKFYRDQRKVRHLFNPSTKERAEIQVLQSRENSVKQSSDLQE